LLERRAASNWNCSKRRRSSGVRRELAIQIERLYEFGDFRRNANPVVKHNIYSFIWRKTTSDCDTNVCLHCTESVFIQRSGFQNKSQMWFFARELVENLAEICRVNFIVS